ncbi:hypothetical protein UA08_01899 [Talaromyces atroroseus]|uniref:RHS repeat-associated core domain-containing protein n=1 Tax=Talaromyces atroroseus TaxID=1441469 RepID=A0A1Q5QAE2_TALAT|nr:hypothetical protein UA08_01899 [Talaromyces atroroseus]OKL62729.1 hypothetical protein UA08_01899 [Talaromyces atroroseus]
MGGIVIGLLTLFWRGFHLRCPDYSGRGTHANYAIAGIHDHTINLPFGPVNDNASNGTLWDPTGNYYAYSYDNMRNSFTPHDSGYPVNWLYSNGQWGDMQLAGPDGVFAEYKYTGGPNGPKFKHLVRSNVSQWRYLQCA